MSIFSVSMLITTTVIVNIVLEDSSETYKTSEKSLFAFSTMSNFSNRHSENKNTTFIINKDLRYNRKVNQSLSIRSI